MPAGDPHQRQHLVSQVLLEQFADPHLDVLDVITGKLRQSSPKSEGWHRDYIAHQPSNSENRWQEIEGRVPSTLAALAGREPLDEVTVGTLKDVFALHWARGDVLKVIHDELIGPYLEEHPELVVDDITEKDFFKRYGLYPAGTGALGALRREYLDRALRLHDEDAFFAERVHDNFDTTRRQLELMGIDVGIPERGEFLISDRPATTKQHGNPGVGPLQGVPWGKADAAPMPLAPDLLSTDIWGSPWADTKPPHRRTAELPVGGHEISPLMVRSVVSPPCRHGPGRTGSCRLR